MKHLKITLQVVAIATYLGLASCANSPPKVSVESLKNNALPADSGIVVAETLTNSDRLTGPLVAWNELILWRVDKGLNQKEPATFSLESLARNTESQQYLGVVPEGTYALGLLWANLIKGDVTYWAKAYAPPVFGTFQVKAGEVTNLGRIIYHPFQARSVYSVELPDYAMTRIDAENLVARISREYPDLADQLNTNIVHSWNNPDFNKLGKEGFDLIKQSASVKKVSRLNNQILLVGRLGKLESLEGWETNFTDRVLRDAALVKEGIFAIGGEFGTFALISSTGEVISQPDILDSEEHVYQLSEMDNGRIAITTVFGNSFRIYIYKEGEEKAERIAIHNRVKGGLFGMPSKPFVEFIDDKLVVYVDGNAHTYDFTNQSWTKESAKRFVDISQQPNGIIVARTENLMGLSNPHKISLDQGKSWSTFKTRVDNELYVFSDGETVRTGKIGETKRWTGKFVEFEEIKFLTTKDKGISWYLRGKLPKGCHHIATEASTDEQLLVLCRDGRITQSRDRGRSWEFIREKSSLSIDKFPELLRLQFER